VNYFRSRAEGQDLIKTKEFVVMRMGVDSGRRSTEMRSRTEAGERNVSELKGSFWAER
jgi:hypothetical protein